MTPSKNAVLKICNYCSSPFLAKHANTKYCSDCNRKTVWSRRKAINSNKVVDKSDE